MTRTPLRILTLATAGALALAATACRDDAYATRRDAPEGQPGSPDVQEQLDQQWESAKEAAEQRLETIKKRYAELEEEAKARGEAAQARFEELKMDLQPKLEKAEAQVEQLAAQGADAWREASTKAEQALTEVSNGIQDAWDELTGNK